MEHDDINQILNRRMTPRTPEGLAERIIHAAVRSLQEEPPQRTIWAELSSMFVLPHPSVVVAMGVVIGLAVGLQAGDGLTILSQDWASFMDINEGAWL